MSMNDRNDIKSYWRCGLCGMHSPIDVVTCQNPNCEADLLLYGEAVFEENQTELVKENQIQSEQKNELGAKAPAEFQRPYWGPNDEPPKAVIVDEIPGEKKQPPVKKTPEDNSALVNQRIREKVLRNTSGHLFGMEDEELVKTKRFTKIDQMESSTEPSKEEKKNSSWMFRGW